MKQSPDKISASDFSILLIGSVVHGSEKVEMCYVSVLKRVTTNTKNAIS